MYSEPAAYPRPSRRPVYRWYPMSWMTPSVAGMAGLLLRGGGGGEQFGHPVPALVQPVQRQVQFGHGTEDGVVRAVGLQRHQQQPPVPPDRQPERGQPL